MNRDRPELPSRPFRNRGVARCRGERPHIGQARNIFESQANRFNQNNIPNSWDNADSYIDASHEAGTSYNRVLSISSLLYPCLHIDIIKEVLLDRNLLLDSQALETLSQRCKSIASRQLSPWHVHPHHLDELDLANYKSRACANQSLCQNPFCPDYHSLGERRRVPVLYSSQLCPDIFNCPSGDLCKFSHSCNEQAYHPERLSLFYSDQQIEAEPDVESLGENDLMRLRDLKLVEKSELMKNLENRLIWLSSLKSKFNCCNCKASQAESVCVPCGHLYCRACFDGDFCEKCRAACSSYKLCQRFVN